MVQSPAVSGPTWCGMFQAASETRLPAIGRLKAASQGLVAQSRMRPRLHMDGCDYIPDFSKEFL